MLLDELFSRLRNLASGVRGLLPGRSLPGVFEPLRPAASNPLAARRDEILRRFDALLDEVLADEAPPAGLPVVFTAEAEHIEPAQAPGAGAAGPPGSDRRPDLYSLWSAMTALAQEVKLQGRAFGRLADAVQKGAPPGRPGSPAAGEIPRDHELHDRGEVLDLLLDIRDRLRRGLASVRSHRTQDAAAALEKGYLLGLERLEEALERFEVREIDCAGKPFDPHRMRAVDVEMTTEGRDGAVLDVYRPGYTWRGDVFRPAEVKVARLNRPGSREEGKT